MSDALFEIISGELRVVCVRQCFCGVMYTKWDNRLSEIYRRKIQLLWKEGRRGEGNSIHSVPVGLKQTQTGDEGQMSAAFFLLDFQHLCVSFFGICYERITMAIENKKKADSHQLTHNRECNDSRDADDLSCYWRCTTTSLSFYFLNIKSKSIKRDKS